MIGEAAGLVAPAFGVLDPQDVALGAFQLVLEARSFGADEGQDRRTGGVVEVLLPKRTVVVLTLGEPAEALVDDRLFVGCPQCLWLGLQGSDSLPGQAEVCSLVSRDSH